MRRRGSSPHEQLEVDSALKAAVACLSKNPWLCDTKAGTNGLRYNLMCSMGLDIVDDDNGMSWSTGERHRFTGEFAEDVINDAMAGDPVAHQALCAVADHLTILRKPLPLALQGYIVNAATAGAKRPSRRGRHRVSNLYRDEAIFQAVQGALAMGFKATRNDAHKTEERESACSIVARALQNFRLAMSEKSVGEIWKARLDAHKAALEAGRLFLGGGVPN